MGKKTKEKQPHNKIDNYFANDSLDIFSDEDYYDEKKSNSQDKNQEDQNSGQLIGKIQQFFTKSDPKEILRITQASEVENIPQSKEVDANPYQPKDYDYIQMKLQISNISNEFKEELEEYRLSGIKIRVVEERDLEIFVKLYNRSFMRGLDPWSPASVDQFKEIIRQENTVVLIASSHAEDVGFIIIDLEGQNNEIGVICGLGVDPRWQRQGIARYLGIASWDYFRKLNVEELRCEVYEKNLPSYQLIKNLHFTEYGKKTYQF